MEKVIQEGYQAFLDEYFEENKELFKELEGGQNPHTMVITCSDSRINPALLLNAEPGDIFIARNIGNVVPPYSVIGGATQAAIEYAVNALNVPRIVIIGHSHCGACAHMYHEHKEGEPTLHHVDEWLKFIIPAKNAAMLEVHKNHHKNIFELTEKHNVVTSLQRLMEYPYIQKRLLNDEIDLVGLWYDFVTGKVEEYNFDTKQFESIV
jgi:carbonic anhydrase